MPVASRLTRGWVAPGAGLLGAFSWWCGAGLGAGLWSCGGVALRLRVVSGSCIAFLAWLWGVRRVLGVARWGAWVLWCVGWHTLMTLLCHRVSYVAS